MFEKSVVASPSATHGVYFAHTDKSRTATNMMATEKPQPSAPPAGAHMQPVKHVDPSLPMAPAPVVAPEPLPPSPIKRSLLFLTLKLIPYHILNFLVGMGGFCVALTDICVSVILLPFCGLGLVVHLVFLQVTRLLVIMDVALANTITRTQAAVHWNVPDEIDEGAQITNELRLAPKLAKLSFRSTIVVLYFVSVKFALGIISAIAVSLPLLPIVSQIVADYTADTINSNIAGFSAHKFNFGTNPFLYFLTCVGYFIAGILLMHVFGRVSRETTRRVCCQTIKPTASTASTTSTTAV